MLMRHPGGGNAYQRKLQPLAAMHGDHLDAVCAGRESLVGDLGTFERNALARQRTRDVAGNVPMAIEHRHL
ncbi:hypothetical protein D3C72_2319300 [compost metagenome]